MKKLKQFVCALLAICLLTAGLPAAWAAEPEARTAGFTDVSGQDWFAEAVAFVNEKNLMNGVGGARFDPNAATSRAMLVAILYRLEDGRAVEGPGSFEDVPDGQWYTAPVRWAASAEIAQGCGDNLFAPNRRLARQDLAVFLYRYAQHRGYDVSGSSPLSGFTDAGKVSGYARPAVAWAHAVGLLVGSNSKLNPTGIASRAETATVLKRFWEYKENQPAPVQEDYQVDGRTVFTLDVPAWWQGSYVSQSWLPEGDDAPVLAFYDKNSFQEDKGWGGLLFWVQLMEDDYTYLPHYRVWGDVVLDGRAYTLVFAYPTDVQFGEGPGQPESYAAKSANRYGIFEHGVTLAE